MVDRSVAPAFITPGKFELPKPIVQPLRNGGTLYALNAGTQPVIKLEFVFKAGIIFEQRPGISLFTSKMLMEGTSTYDSKTIAGTLDQYGAFSEIQPGFDFANFVIHIPKDHFRRVLPVIQEILYHPVFPLHELDLMKQIQVQQVSVNEQKNSYLASRQFRAKLFPDHPYGHMLTTDSIERVNADWLEKFYQQRFHGRFDIFLTGQFDETMLAQISELSAMATDVPELPIKYTSKGEPFFVEKLPKEGSLQSSIQMGRKCISRSHPDFPVLLLLNEVFGGYFGSRLMQNIREEKGFSYSIYSHAALLKEDSYFVIGTDVKKDTRDQTIEEIEKEIRRIKTEPIGTTEINEARNHLKGSILNTLTTPFALTEKWKNIYLYGLGTDFYDRLFDRVDGIDSIELMTFANENLFSQPLSYVAVG